MTDSIGQQVMRIPHKDIGAVELKIKKRLPNQEFLVAVEKYFNKTNYLWYYILVIRDKSKLFL
jgi:hypothetical protein